MERLTDKVIEKGLNAYEAIQNGLFPAIERLGTKFWEGEIFVPELLMPVKTMMVGLEK